MYEEKIWQDHVTEFENRYKEQENPDGTITHVPVEGEVMQQGTPQSAANFNNMENGISGSGALAGILIIHAIHAKQQMDDLDSEVIQLCKNLEGDVIQVTLTNSEAYPFNNSQKTIALGTARNNANYTVQTEVVSTAGGGLKAVEITDKLTNGFKVAFQGSATQVVLKLTVKGGFYNG